MILENIWIPELTRLAPDFNTNPPRRREETRLHENRLALNCGFRIADWFV
jgi:hypothetical protein